MSNFQSIELGKIHSHILMFKDSYFQSSEIRQNAVKCIDYAECTENYGEDTLGLKTYLFNLFMEFT